MTENVTITFEQDDKKAVAKMTIDGNLCKNCL